MNSRTRWLQALFPMFAIVFAAGTAQALTLHKLKGQGLDNIYGTYASGGDCQREPRVIAGDPGFTYQYRGTSTHPKTFEYAVAFFSGGHAQVSAANAAKRVIFPFGMNDDSNMRMIFDTNSHSLVIKAYPPRGKRLTGLKAALVRRSPYARCATHTASTPSGTAKGASSGTRKIDFGKDTVKPTAAQAAAILRAATRASEKDMVDCGQAGCYAMVPDDINDDGRPDLLVQAQNMGYCGSAGCEIDLLLATAHGYARDFIGLAYAGSEFDVLHTRHHGMHDLRYNGDSPVWQWNGKEYVINKNAAGSDDGAGSGSGSNAPPWKTAQAAGYPLTAYAAPVDSTIKRLLVSCQNGQPLLTMLTKAPRPAGPATLTFVFNGWTLKLPMQRNIYNTNRWMADLSRSQLPEWLAHRGHDATTAELARKATQAFLRINGRMEGQISLSNSTAATRAALAGCYRY